MAVLQQEKHRNNMSNKESLSPHERFNLHTLTRNNTTTSRNTRWGRVRSESHPS